MMKIIKNLLLTILIIVLNQNIGITQNSGVTLGISAGPETAIGIPELGGYYKYYDKEVKLYAGGEGSAWVLFTFWYSLNLYHRIEYKFITVETSFAYFEYTKIDTQQGDFGPFRHLTFTPKLGTSINNSIQVQAGPSFFLYRKYSEPIDDFELLTFTKSGNIHMNYEISMSFEF